MVRKIIKLIAFILRSVASSPLGNVDGWEHDNINTAFQTGGQYIFSKVVYSSRLGLVIHTTFQLFAAFFRCITNRGR